MQQIINSLLKLWSTIFRVLQTNMFKSLTLLLTVIYAVSTMYTCMIVITTSTTILLLKKKQNCTKLDALYATKLIKGDKTVTKRKVMQLQAEVNTESPIIILP